MNTNVPEWDFWQLVGGLVGISMLLMIVLLTVWWFAFRTKQNKKLKVRPLPALCVDRHLAVLAVLLLRN
jgi:hypothetical protein